MLIIVGLAIEPAGTLYFGMLGNARYGAELISFGVLVFMIGITFVASERKVEKNFIGYMWVAAFIIIGSLTGVSLYTLLGGIVKPP